MGCKGKKNRGILRLLMKTESSCCNHEMAIYQYQPQFATMEKHTATAPVMPKSHDALIVQPATNSY
ncbi:hypothetical protein GmHk_05G012624 [Glycine max]|nr:hypothetical protein GmHk_05G012624 [Glycine max]